MRIVNKEAIIDNIRRIMIKNSIILVLKDNAYGFGICYMVSIAKKLNIKEYAVKNIDEAKFIKSLDNTANILILGKINRHWIDEIKKYKFIPTINDYEDYILFKENNILCHLAIDIGMNRFGMKENYLDIIDDEIIKSIYIHVYNNYCNDKIRFFENLAKKHHKDLHIGGSYAIGKTKATLRIGKALYENSLSLFGNIVNIKKVKKDENIGYDNCYQAKDNMKIGICDIGYSNGLNLFFNGRVWIKNKYYRCVGKCCMDQCFIIIDDGISIGDKVEFFGQYILEDEFLRENKMTKYQLYLNINKNNI